jgi:hypothetical protein
MKRTLSTILLTIVSTIAFAQDGHITYTDQSNSKNFGRDVLVRSDAANLDTLTSVYAGSIAYDTTQKSIKVHDGAQWQSLSFGLTKDTSITIASAAVLTLNSSPVTIVPAPGAGYAIEVISASAKMVYNSVAYATNTTIQVESNGATTPQFRLLNGINQTISSHRSLGRYVSANTETQIIENADLMVTVAGGDPTAGDSDIKVYLRYRLIEL